MAQLEQWGSESSGDHSLPELGYFRFLSLNSCFKDNKSYPAGILRGAVVTSQPDHCMPLNLGAGGGEHPVILAELLWLLKATE